MFFPLVNYFSSVIWTCVVDACSASFTSDNSSHILCEPSINQCILCLYFHWWSTNLNSSMVCITLFLTSKCFQCVRTLAEDIIEDTVIWNMHVQPILSFFPFNIFVLNPFLLGFNSVCVCVRADASPAVTESPHWLCDIQKSLWHEMNRQFWQVAPQ